MTSGTRIPKATQLVVLVASLIQDIAGALTQCQHNFSHCDTIFRFNRRLVYFTIEGPPSQLGEHRIPRRAGCSGKLRLMRRDPIELEIFKNLYHSIAEEMGAALRRTAFSPNIKERRDYSCAVFDSAGEVIAMGDHMPVHLGSMPMSVRAAIAASPLFPGDVVMLNDPFRGGTHLPDITLVAPVYVGRGGGRVRRSR